MAVPAGRKGITRREALGVIGAAVGGLVIGDKLTSPSSTTESEPVLKVKPKAIYKGKAEIILRKNLNFRTDLTTESTNIPIERIFEVYGVDIKGKEKITIENFLVLDGQNPTTLTRTGGDWIALKTKYKNAIGQDVADYLFVSRSQQTSDLVKPDYGTGKDLQISQVRNGQYILSDGTPFQEKIGIVTPSPK